MNLFGRTLFDDFDPSSVATFTEKKLLSLRLNGNTLLSEPKLRAVVENANQTLKVRILLSYSNPVCSLIYPLTELEHCAESKGLFGIMAFGVFFSYFGVRVFSSLDDFFHRLIKILYFFSSS